MYRRFFKRFIDIILSLTAFIGFWWVYAIVALLIKIKLGSPVIFKQERPGKNGEIFIMYKFRSMTDEKDDNGVLLLNEKRLTKFGKLLRATSLDELPEIWNVLRGEMSFVGPRPLLVEYLERYSTEQARRHEVRPGITGWAQVNGRNSISWEKKFSLDVDYVIKYNFLMDIKIIFLTIKKVFVKEGINQTEKVTMTKFLGNQKRRL